MIEFFFGTFRVEVEVEELVLSEESLL